MNIDKILKDYVNVKINLKQIEDNYASRALSEDIYIRDKRMKQDELKNFFRTSLIHINKYVKDNLNYEFSIYKKGQTYDSMLSKKEGLIKKTPEEFINEYNYLINYIEKNCAANSINLLKAITIIKDYSLES